MVTSNKPTDAEIDALRITGGAKIARRAGEAPTVSDSALNRLSPGMRERYLALRQDFDGINTIGHAEFKAQVLDKLAATKASIRARVPKDRAVSANDIDREAREQLLAPVRPVITRQAQEMRRRLTSTMTEAQQELQRMRAANRRVAAPDALVTEAEMKDARPIEIALLQEYRLANRREATRETRTRVAGQPIEDNVRRFEQLTFAMEAERARVERSLKAEEDKVSAARHEPEVFGGVTDWRERSIQRAQADLARARVQAEAPLRAFMDEASLLQSVIHEQLEAPIAEPPADSNLSGESIVKAMFAAKSARETHRQWMATAEDRLVPLEQREAELEVASALKSMDERLTVVGMTLNEIAKAGMPVGITEEQWLAAETLTA